MKPKIGLKTFNKRLKIALDNDKLEEAHEAINLYHYGSEEVPLHIAGRDLPIEHQDAAHNIHRSFYIDVELELFSDGTVRAVKIIEL